MTTPNPSDKRDEDKRNDDKANPLQGEGNYAAARRYDKATTDFTQSGQVPDAAQRAQPRSEEEARALKEAEEKGASHAKR
jgi:hypothetical protein